MNRELSALLPALVVHISEAHDGGILARFAAYDDRAVDALKNSHTADEWAGWLADVGAWHVPRAVWRRAEQRLRARGFVIEHLSMPDEDTRVRP